MLRRATVFLCLMFVLTACTVRLLPVYDEALYSGLDAANVKAQTLFSAVAGGSPRSAFGQNAPAYNDTIGTFAALLTRAQSRPQPSIGRRASDRLMKLGTVADLCAEIAPPGEGEPDCLALVTPYAIAEIVEIVEILSKMRDRHKAAGLGALTTEGFVNDYNISIEQAMTVEAALQD